MIDCNLGRVGGETKIILKQEVTSEQSQEILVLIISSDSDIKQDGLFQFKSWTA